MLARKKPATPAPPRRLPHDAGPFHYSGPWKVIPVHQNTPCRMGGGGEHSQLSLAFHGTSITLEFWSHPWSGHVRISVDNKEQIADLFHPDGAFKHIRIGNLPAGQHHLWVTGTPGRHPQSQGHEIIFAGATITEGAADESGEIVEVLGHRMLLHNPHHGQLISTHLAAHGIFQPLQTRWLCNFIRPGDTVLDIGADIGYYTLLMGRLAGQHGKVFAFEGDPENFGILEKNVRLNGYADRIVLKRASATEVTAQHRLLPNARPSITMPSVSLDDAFQDYPGRIDFIRIDSQNAAWTALHGMKKLLARQPRITVMTEFRPMALPDGGGCAAAFLDRLTSLGFSLFHIDDEQHHVAAVDQPRLLERYTLKKRNFTNLLCVKNAAAPIIQAK
jgi:FkbM family methyltransferase